MNVIGVVRAISIDESLTLSLFHDGDSLCVWYFGNDPPPILGGTSDVSYRIDEELARYVKEPTEAMPVRSKVVALAHEIMLAEINRQDNRLTSLPISQSAVSILSSVRTPVTKKGKR